MGFSLASQGRTAVKASERNGQLAWTGSSVASAGSSGESIAPSVEVAPPVDNIQVSPTRPQLNPSVPAAEPQIPTPPMESSGIDPFRDPFGDRSQTTSTTTEPFATPADQRDASGVSSNSKEPGQLRLQNTEPSQIETTSLSKGIADRETRAVRDPRLFQISAKESHVATGISPNRQGMELARAFDRIELVPELRDPDLGGTPVVRPFQASVPSMDKAMPMPSEGIVLQAAMFTAEELTESTAAEPMAENAQERGAAEELPTQETTTDSDAEGSLLEEKSDPFTDDENTLDDLPPANDDDTESSKKAKCERIYNEENCCDTESECRKMLTKLNSRSIRDISLDIAPPFDPLGEDPAESNKLKEKKLSEIPSRVFLDRNGNTLAEGQLTDLRENNVIIRSADGTETPVRLSQLGVDDQCFVSAWWNLPVDCQSEISKYELRDFTMLTFTWTASALCHKPLYFEDVQLERYGHSFNPWVQPLMSGAHFYASLALLPYNMGLARPNECQYDLGYYRPGNCAPWLMSAFPWSRRAVLSQVGAAAGLHGILN